MALLLVVFMTVTFVISTELIAVLSIGQVWSMHKFLRTHSRLDVRSYDIHRTYRHSQATGAVIVHVSHYAIYGWVIWMGCWATILHQANKRRPGLGENIPHYVQ